MQKLLVANRGEIAIRAFRAAYQLDIDTVAIHTFEDRNSLHRLKADEAYEIGEHGHPVRAYLDPIAIVAAAKQSGADAVYPGYGFLSESPDFAEAVIEAGLAFVGPSVEVLKVTGNKQRARDAAEAAGLPVLQQSPALTPESDLVALSETIGFPLFVKAAAGGGGRGMRRVEHPSGLVEAVDAAMREALSAFGDDTVFLEEAITDVRHIEVQVLGDNAGNIIHLYERDCSVQRRFQKVVEIAPAPDLTAAQQQALTSDAVTFAHHINYVNAGTVEFLVDTSGRHVFIEMNPRIQVEHTVTEEVTDTTLRDAHQSILATRVRSIDLTRGAEAIAHATSGLLSLECWGGATFDVALRFLHEDPWKRLEALREAAPNLCLQMLIRGRNAVGYSPYPDVVARTFVAEAHRTGIDIFRVFDAFNDIEQMRPAIEAAIEVGAVAEGTLCYSGNMTDPGEDLYTLDYYLGVAEKLVDAGAHILCIKDMAGLLRAPAASILISALRDRFDTPVHLHSHDTSGGQLATYAAAAQAGVDAVDGAAPPLSGLTSQPSLSAIIAATEHTERDTGLSLDAVGELEPYWEAVRALYKPFEAGLTSPTGTVYKHEIPGGQLSNLRQQAIALGLGDRFEEVEHLYATCNVLLGRPIKVTPSSKVVGDLALHLVASGVTPAQLENDPESVDLPESVIKFLHGELGTPPAGFPEPFRTKALVGRPYTPTPAELDPIDEQALQGDDVRKVLNRLLLPGPAASQEEQAARYGNLAVLPSRIFWYGLDINQGDRSVELRPGVNVLVGLEAVGEPNDDGIRSVVFRLNGQFRPIDIRDRHVASNVITSEKAKLHTPGHVAAPFRGVVSVSVAPGDTVEAGDSVAVIEAMKMESAISAGVSGTVSRVVVPLAAAVEPGDLLVEIRPAGLAEEI